MAYDKDKIFKQAQEAVENNNLFFIEDILAYIPCNRDTFYRLFPVESDKYDALKELLEHNKVRTKLEIRRKLFDSTKAGELLALYRMICTAEERRMLNQNYIELTGKDQKPLIPDAKEIGKEVRRILQYSVDT